ncbi:MFS transporter [Burkholderia cepacia]|uniref:MFS transporter n=1 Tax=Burkholderia cepacia TaxID=292 RepID=UPI002AB62279|nr:MFS transporter [Burkholderia cepacia]
MPFVFVLFIVNFLNRVNVSFAMPEMQHSLKFSAQVFGMGFGIFSIGYLICEIPSNLILHRVGTRIWIGRIAITWGIVSAAMAAVNSEAMFYVLRFLLGVAEAGFTPGILFFLALWFPRRYQAQAFAKFSMAASVAVIIGAPLSWYIMTLEGLFGLTGWQLMFVLEALPAVVMGVLVLFYFTNHPREATWLPDEQREWLVTTLKDEESERIRQGGTKQLGAALRNPTVLLLAVLYFAMGMGFYGISYWLPQIIRHVVGVSDFSSTALTMLPWICGAGAAYCAGRLSEQSRNQRKLLMCGIVSATIGFAVSALNTSPVAIFLGICVGAIGLFLAMTVFWVFPGQILAGAAAAGGFAFINVVGILGGFVSPYLIGVIVGATKNFAGAYAVIAGSLFLGIWIAAGVLYLSGRRVGTIS